MESSILNAHRIKHLLSQPNETEWLEFKENMCENKKLGEILSAVSNSANLNGCPFGYVVFGVNDMTKKVVGTVYDPSAMKEGNEELEGWLMRLISPKLTLKITKEIYEGHQIVIFSIPAATDSPTTFGASAYVRIGTLTRNLKDYKEHERRIWQNNDNRSFEKLVALPKVTDDVLRLLDYPLFFKITGQNLPDNKHAIMDKLEESRFIQKNEGLYDITNLGALLFAYDLGKFPTISRKAPRVIVYDGKNKTVTKLEQAQTRGYAASFEKIINFVNGQLPSNEVIKQAFRVDEKLYPEIAIRELVANALIHQDLFEKGTSPMIEIYDDRIEIVNPGRPLVDVQRFIDHSPRSRNEDLASFMRQIKICEERGSGIDKVINATEVYQLPAPKFEATDQYTKVTLFAHKKFVAMEKEDKIRACYQHCVLKHVSNSSMNNMTLRARFNISAKNYSVASRIIADTIEAGLIKVKNPESTSTKHVKYIPFWA
jgi:ATP-dependent DNA helicase RecG